jgi:hypothetical protein
MSEAVAARPRGRPPKVSAVAPEPPALDDHEDGAALETLDPEELVDEALAHRVPLTPAVVNALNKTRRDIAQYDDEDSKRRSRLIDGVLRRASHRELHPNCTRVEIDVPVLPNKVFVRINERAYYGRVEVWECEARTILEAVHRSRLVEAARNTDKPGDVTLDLDSPLAERARAIQRA